MITVVNCKIVKPDIYIGRYNPRFGTGLLYNHYAISLFVSRQMVIEMFERDFFENTEPRFKRGIKQIMDHHDIHGDTTIGCWCKPEACHGDIIADYLNQRILQCQK